MTNRMSPMGLNGKPEPGAGAARFAAAGPEATASARALESDLPRFCLEPEAGELNRAMGWVVSICVAYLIFGLIGIRQAAIVVHKRAPAREEAVPTVIEPLVTPPQTSTAAAAPEEPSSERNAEAGAPVVAVTADSNAIAFAVPTVGNVLVPLSMAQPPPERPIQALAPVSSLKLDTTNAPRLEAISAPKIEEISLTSTGGSRPPPTYPYESQKYREQGTVVLHIEVDASGKVLSVTVKQLSGYPRLDQAALEQVERHWFFEPAGGKRLYASRIVFRLE